VDAVRERTVAGAEYAPASALRSITLEFCYARETGVPLQRDWQQAPRSGLLPRSIGSACQFLAGARHEAGFFRRTPEGIDTILVRYRPIQLKPKDCFLVSHWLRSKRTREPSASRFPYRSRAAP
jgi:hypothetical protein